MKPETKIQLPLLDKESTIVDSSYPYLAIGDLEDTLNRLSPSISQEVIEDFQNSLFTILEIMSPPQTTFTTLQSSDINQQIDTRLSHILTLEPNTAVVILDRYINDPAETSNVFRLEISRRASGGLVARPGTTTSPEDQILSLVSWIEKYQPSNLVLTDDVLAFADTSIPLIKLIKDKLPDVSIHLLTGIASSGGAWSGIEKVREQTNVDPESIVLVKASPETQWSLGMALPTSRDFTVFGGKIDSSIDGPTAISLPYFLPFSIPQPSFVLDKDILSSSEHLLTYNILLVETLNRNLGRQLTIQDLINSGFGIPISNLDSISQMLPLPTPETPLLQYLQYCQSLLENHSTSILEEITQKRQL
jgi:hypothetical protein